jgi:hypothetical protein
MYYIASLFDLKRTVALPLGSGVLRLPKGGTTN